MRTSAEAPEGPSVTPPGPAAALSVEAEPADPGSIARLEVALSALVRWSESKHTRSEVAQRSGCDLQAGPMRLLEHFDVAGPMRVSDIADCLKIDISTVSLQLRELLRVQLVNRVADGRDRRVAMIVITVEGRATVARVRAARRELLAQVFARVRPDELEQATGVLIRVQEHMLADMIAELRSTS
ncbi:MarR family transcriptional regulator [Frankia sp. AiPs1]|uniref:MarR family winged helix-turn-helix transcriptional regulator n=1 Tax=Frankia sp. AiPs1 TaxID=573493 RepID=UPI002043857D|nr:MarR family transcriptional regulator [Frankia sp. AiPs1]MCM3920668.1 MarR family transcriptional regulator [Frankia sp. AiPs1]